METVQLANDLIAKGKTKQAFALLSEATDMGNGKAAYQLAEWRMVGDFIRRDIAEARRLFGCAANTGLQKAEGPYLALLANGAGNIGRCWNEALDRLRSRAKTQTLAQIQYDLLAKMDLDEKGDPRQAAEAVSISTRPDIRKLPQFLTSAECRYVAELAIPLLQPSVVVHPVTGTLVRDPVRTSMATAFPFIAENPVLHAINRRIALATGTSYAQGEPLQVLSYAPGQEYKPHSDALPNASNQRVKTALVYLNTDYGGGETFFTKTGLRFRGQQGDAIVFSNVDAFGHADTTATHAGLQVISGQKLILSKWIRAQPLDLAGPAGRPF